MYGFGRGVWYQFTPPFNGEMVVDTLGSLFKPAFATYSGSCGSLTEIGCNDAAVGTAGPVTNSVAAGVTYYILAGSYSNVVGGYTNDTLVLHLTFTPQSPVILPPVLDSNRFLFSFPTISGQTYVVEYRISLGTETGFPFKRIPAMAAPKP